MGVPEARRPAGRTHLIAGSPVWLTPEEAEELTQRGQEAKDAFDASEEGRKLARWREGYTARQRQTAAATEMLRTPEGMDLRVRRDRLVDELSAAGEVESAERAAAHETGDPGPYYRSRKLHLEAAIDRAQADLDAFDREYPDLLTALKARRDDNVRRAMES